MAQSDAVASTVFLVPAEASLSPSSPRGSHVSHNSSAECRPDSHQLWSASRQAVPMDPTASLHQERTAVHNVVSDTVASPSNIQTPPLRSWTFFPENLSNS